jgi:hypothetical protein
VLGVIDYGRAEKSNLVNVIITIRTVVMVGQYTLPCITYGMATVVVMACLIVDIKQHDHLHWVM